MGVWKVIIYCEYAPLEILNAEFAPICSCIGYAEFGPICVVDAVYPFY